MDLFKSMLRKKRKGAMEPTIILGSKGKRKVLYETDEQFFNRHKKKKW